MCGLYVKSLGVIFYLEFVCKRLYGIHIKLFFHFAQKHSGFRHLQRIWGASGNLWQNTWNQIYHAFGENDLFIGVAGEQIFTICLVRMEI